MHFITLKKCNESQADIWIEGTPYKRCELEHADIIIKL